MGTLGRSDNEPFNWSGFIECSKKGNEDSKGFALKEIKNLYGLHKEIRESGQKIIERYISLDYLEFDDFPETLSIEDIPELRLTLFLKNDEGAQVFLQHYSGSGIEDDIEYMLCEPTTNNTTTGRDRLTYNIPVFPRNVLESTHNGARVKLTSLTETSRFVIKTLIFKREESNDSKSLLKSVIHSKIRKDFKVFKYDLVQNKFIKLLGPNSIRKDLKTLILIHGTAASINGSFKGLLKEDYKGSRSWLEHVITSGQNPIQQVIGIDHDTLTKSAIENAKEFVDFMRTPHFFDQPVSILTTSRGGMVGKTLCGKPEYKQFISVDKAILIACANNCGYLVKSRVRKRRKRRAVNMLLTGLTKMVDIGSPWIKVLKFLATQSYQFALSLPGLQTMMEGHKIQKEIVGYTPSPITTFYPIIGKEKAKKWYWGALGKIPKMLFINRLLGRDHDWVLGTKPQFIMPPNSMHQQFRGKNYSEVMVNVQNHCRYLNSNTAYVDRDGSWDDKMKGLVFDYLVLP